MSQRTSVVAVTDDQARQIGRMVEDAARKYSGGLEKMELVKGDPDFLATLYAHWDARAALRGQTLAIQERPVWKTVKTGNQKSNKELRAALTDAKFRISEWGSDILGKTPVASKPGSVSLVLVTVADLGFPEGATREKIYEKALSLDLQLCPAEVGPQLRLQYTDQPLGEWILVSMEPIVDSGGYPYVFRVERDGGGRWLNGRSGHAGSFWSGAHRLVFARK